jgi:asparagine synthase (glutamine-hydrolysing)
MERMGYFDFLTLLVDGILTKVDRRAWHTALSAGAAPRPPRRRIRLVTAADFQVRSQEREQAPAAPSPVSVRAARNSSIAPRKGFASPLAIWLRGPLRDWADELLDERQIRENGFFDSARVRACWNDHLRGTSDHWRLPLGASSCS